LSQAPPQTRDSWEVPIPGSHELDTISAFESKVSESLPLLGSVWLVLSSAWEFPAF